jgi:hypothetical protein
MPLLRYLTGLTLAVLPLTATLLADLPGLACDSGAEEAPRAKPRGKR